MEDVVAEDQRDGLVADEVGAEDEGLGDALRPLLHGVLQVEAELRAVAEEALELLTVLRSGDDQNLADPRHDERGKRVVDHRLVEDREKLLGNGPGQGPEAGTGAARKKNAAHGAHLTWPG